jgi:alpha-galactosidase
LLGVKYADIIAKDDAIYFKSQDEYLNRLTYKLYKDSFLYINIDTILVLGNSITFHDVRKDIGWNSKYGMAASCINHDFCHIIQKALKKKDPNSIVIPYNISSWERNFSINKDSLILPKLKGAKVVLIRLGENITDSHNYEQALENLVTYIKRKRPCKIIITGCFWPDYVKDGQARMVAAKYDIPYISIYQYHSESNLANKGGLATDTLGHRYHFKGDFIGSHPNDKGMQCIANAILKLIIK